MGFGATSILPRYLRVCLTRFLPGANPGSAPASRTPLGRGQPSPRREAAPPPRWEALGASCGLDDIHLSVCLAPGLRAAGLVATPLQALTQAGLSSPAATGHCRWKWISTLINPWLGWTPSFGWFFQEPHPSIISSLVCSGLAATCILLLPPPCPLFALSFLGAVPCPLAFSFSGFPW